MNRYTCICCDHEEEFESAKAAYDAGWDVEPDFTCQPLCNLCPAAHVALDGLDAARRRHAESHARWKREGRPTQFEWDREQALNDSKGTSIQ